LKKKNSDTNMSSTTSGVGDTYGELPEDSVDCRMNDNNRKGSNGVQFRSQSSIEQVRRISRVSNYDMDEIINYWGEGDEHTLQKSELKQAVKEMYFTRRASDMISHHLVSMIKLVKEEL